MSDSDWDAVLKKYGTCSSYADTGTLISNGESELQFLTHFVRPNRLRLEWRGVPLEEHPNGGPLEHSILLKWDEQILGADLLDDNCWHRYGYETISDAINSVSWRSGVGEVAIALLLNDEKLRGGMKDARHNVPVSVPYAEMRYGIGCRANIRTNPNHEIKESDFTIIARNQTKMGLLKDQPDKSDILRRPQWYSGSNFFLHTITFDSVEFDKGSYPEIFSTTDEALSPLISSL